MNKVQKIKCRYRISYEKKGYSPTGNMRCKLHVLGKFVFSGDVFGDLRLSILVDPYVSVC